MYILKAFSNISARGIEDDYIYISKTNRINKVIKE